MEEVEKIISDVLSAMGFCDFKIVLKRREGEIDSFNVELNDSKHLIGYHGMNLKALGTLIHLIAHNKNLTQKFVVDVNNYRELRKKSVIKIAKEASQEVVRTKRPVVLRPMDAYERHLVHDYLSDNSSVMTESIGEGESRKVVVSPAGFI